MTQKLTDYDKAEEQSYKDYSSSDLRATLGQENEWLAHKTGFRDGYRFGMWQQMEKQKAESYEKSQNVDHFRDTTKMMRYEIAKAAMQGLMANTKVYDGAKNSPRYAEHTIPEVIAMESIALADALIKELGKEEE